MADTPSPNAPKGYGFRTGTASARTTGEESLARAMAAVPPPAAALSGPAAKYLTRSATGTDASLAAAAMRRRRKLTMLLFGLIPMLGLALCGALVINATLQRQAAAQAGGMTADGSIVAGDCVNLDPDKVHPASCYGKHDAKVLRVLQGVKTDKDCASVNPTSTAVPLVGNDGTLCVDTKQ